MQEAIKNLDQNWKRHLGDLIELAKIPSVSFPGFPEEKVRESANKVAQLLQERGFENVEVLNLKGAHPYVYGDWLHAEGAPTLLLYAHHDVQPPGREEIWKTPPFEPVQKPGPGGDRLYGRGTADDKAGIIVHTASVSALLQTRGRLPVNVKLVVEGEEECGSAHLFEFLKKFKTKLQADLLVLTDCSNFDVGVPALTTSLRGLIGFDVEVRALKNTLHSGMWGGPIPDPAMALCRILSTLVDKDGQIAVAGVKRLIPKISPQLKRERSKLPFNEKEFRQMSGMVEGAELMSNGAGPYSQIWDQPSLTVNAIQSSSRKQAGNIINDSAWARVSLRVCPGMDADRAAEALKTHLKKIVPWGLELELVENVRAPAWVTRTDGKLAWAFEAATRAMEKGYGTKPFQIGCGGSIPFVKPFAEALGGIPALLVGVEDPYTNAHGENESLLIEDLKKACASQIHLFDEISRIKIK